MTGLISSIWKLLTVWKLLKWLKPSGVGPISLLWIWWTCVHLACRCQFGWTIDVLYTTEPSSRDSSLHCCDHNRTLSFQFHHIGGLRLYHSHERRPGASIPLNSFWLDHVRGCTWTTSPVTSWFLLVACPSYDPHGFVIFIPSSGELQMWPKHLILWKQRWCSGSL